MKILSMVSVLVAGICMVAVNGWAQRCKVPFSVSYFDGQTFQTGLTKEQGEFWSKHAKKHYKNFCLDGEKPEYWIVWTLNLDAPPDLKFEANQVEGHPLGAGPWQGSTSSFSILGNPSGTSASVSWVAVRNVLVQKKAHYFVFDLQVNPPKLLRQGVGFIEAPSATTPMGRLETGQKVGADAFASTVADPAEAMKNALDWMRKHLAKKK